MRCIFESAYSRGNDESLDGGQINAAGSRNEAIQKITPGIEKMSGPN
jgi:hypothetical protein